VSPSRVLSRRRFLHWTTTAGVAAALAGCATTATRATRKPAPTSPWGTEAGTQPATVRTDVRIAEDAIASEAALLALCAAAGRAHRGLREPLARLVAHQDEHIATLRAALTEPKRRHRPRRRRLSGSRANVVQRVRRGLADAQTSRRDDAMAARSGALARVLASMSASHAVAASLDSLQP
jgi:hypothetical protein